MPDASNSRLRDHVLEAREPSHGLLQGQAGYQLPDQAEVSEEEFEPSTTRSQIGCAIQTAPLAEKMVALATGTCSHIVASETIRGCR